MVSVSRCGLTGVITLGTLRIRSNKGREFISGLTDHAMKGSGTKMICKAKGYSNGRMGVDLKGSLKGELCTDMEFILGRMAGGTRGTMIQIKSKGKELIHTQTAVSIQGIGSKVSSTG